MSQIQTNVETAMNRKLYNWSKNFMRTRANSHITWVAFEHLVQVLCVMGRANVTTPLPELNGELNDLRSFDISGDTPDSTDPKELKEYELQQLAVIVKYAEEEAFTQCEGLRLLQHPYGIGKRSYDLDRYRLTLAVQVLKEQSADSGESDSALVANFCERENPFKSDNLNIRFSKMKNRLLVLERLDPEQWTREAEKVPPLVDRASQDKVEKYLLRIFQTLDTATQLHEKAIATEMVDGSDQMVQNAHWLKLYRNTEMNNDYLALGCRHVLFTTNLKHREVYTQFPEAVNVSRQHKQIGNDLLVESMVAGCYHAIVQLANSTQKPGRRDPKPSEQTALYGKRKMDGMFEQGGTGYKDLLIERKPWTRSNPVMHDESVTMALQAIGVLTNDVEELARHKRFDKLAPGLRLLVRRELLAGGFEANVAAVNNYVDKFRTYVMDTYVEVKTADARSSSSNSDIVLGVDRKYSTEALLSKLVAVLCRDRALDPGWRSQLYNVEIWDNLRMFAYRLPETAFPDLVRTAIFPWKDPYRPLTDADVPVLAESRTTLFGNRGRHATRDQVGATNRMRRAAEKTMRGMMRGSTRPRQVQPALHGALSALKF